MADQRSLHMNVSATSDESAMSATTMEFGPPSPERLALRAAAAAAAATAAGPGPPRQAAPGPAREAAPGPAHEAADGDSSDGSELPTTQPYFEPPQRDVEPEEPETQTQEAEEVVNDSSSGDGGDDSNRLVEEGVEELSEREKSDDDNSENSELPPLLIPGDIAEDFASLLQCLPPMEEDDLPIGSLAPRKPDLPSHWTEFGKYVAGLAKFHAFANVNVSYGKPTASPTEAFIRKAFAARRSQSEPRMATYCFDYLDAEPETGKVRSMKPVSVSAPPQDTDVTMWRCEGCANIQMKSMKECVALWSSASSATAGHFLCDQCPSKEPLVEWTW